MISIHILFYCIYLFNTENTHAYSCVYKVAQKVRTFSILFILNLNITIKSVRKLFEK